MRYMLVSTADKSKKPLDIPDEMIPDKIKKKKCRGPTKKNKTKKTQSSAPIINYKKVLKRAKQSKKRKHAHRGNK